MTSALPCSYIPVTQILTAMLTIAAEHHQAGRHADARTLYNEVLALDPRHSDALFLLGALERQTGRLEQARQHLCEAARWAADRSPVEAELRIVERLITQRKSRLQRPVQSWSFPLPGGLDGAAHFARA